MLLLLPMLTTGCASTVVLTEDVVPCSALLIVQPRMSEIAVMDATTKRQMLANNDVIKATCKGKTNVKRVAVPTV